MHSIWCKSKMLSDIFSICKENLRLMPFFVSFKDWKSYFFQIPNNFPFFQTIFFFSPFESFEVKKFLAEIFVDNDDEFFFILSSPTWTLASKPWASLCTNGPGLRSGGSTVECSLHIQWIVGSYLAIECFSFFSYSFWDINMA